MDFKISEEQEMIISTTKLFVEKELYPYEDLLEKIKEGEIVEGIVKNITDYGAFIDLGGLDGLLHITDISWSRVTNPEEFLNVGEEILSLIHI